MNKKKFDKKKKYHKGPSDQDLYLTSVKGFIITADPKKEKNAVRDAYNFLNKVEKSSLT